MSERNILEEMQDQFAEYEELAPRVKRFKIAGEIFVLKEMSGEELSRYGKLQINITSKTQKKVRDMIRDVDPKEALANVKSVISGLTDDSDPAQTYEALIHAVNPVRTDSSTKNIEEAVEKAFEISLKSQTPLLEWVLKRDKEWIQQNLTTDMRRKILEAQDELNGIGDYLKNVAPLLLVGM